MTDLDYLVGERDVLSDEDVDVLRLGDIPLRFFPDIACVVHW
jgi:hypothetical protein